MTVLSCLNYKTVPASCIEYVHPWTDSCRDASLGLLIHSFKHSLRTYATLYIATALMKRRKPSKKFIQDTIKAILQSTIFLTTHAYGFSTVLCTLRRFTGSFNALSVAFTPAFLSSLVAIHLERPSRRPILCLYVTNVATETLFRMAVARGLLKPIRHGEVVIFALSMASMLYRFRGDHGDDSTFSLLRFVVGKEEEMQTAAVESVEQISSSSKTRNRAKSNYLLIAKALQIYNTIIDTLKRRAKCPCCPHQNSCLYYVLQGGAKMFATGLTAQLLLRIVFSMKKIVKKPSVLPGLLFDSSNLNLAAFLGCFTSTFRGTLCALRWLRGKDDRIHSIPAGLLAGLAFFFYPDTTPALYIMWKALQMLYQDLTQAGYLPEIPMAMELFYSFSTAVLFHASLMEPKVLRSAYFKFLVAISGGRGLIMDRTVFEPFGLQSEKQMQEVVSKLKMTDPILPRIDVFGKTLSHRLIDSTKFT